MHKLLAQKIEELRRLIGDTRSASFLLAVSGGMDSMCMADLFLNEVGADSFAVAHCNFHLRGEESDGEEALVRDWADSKGVKVHRVDFDTVSYAEEHGVSIEMAARDLRYGWFEQLCDEFGYDVVVVAHNANDNAETLMLNLLRGTGLNGLHGMAEMTILSSKVLLFRPLLEVTRKQIEGYVLAHKVPYRHDSSNFESEYKRNRIRNEVFPIFEKINPSFVRTLNREIGYFAEAGSIVEDWCLGQLPKVLSHPERSEGSLSINIPSLLATAHWRYLLYHILEPYGFNSATVQSLEDLLKSDRTISGKRFESPTHILRTERDELHITPYLNVNQPETSCCPVRGEGIYNFGGVRWQVKLVKMTKDFNLKQPIGTVIMDADKMAFPFVCRAWRQGDWFIPLGLKGRKKISDLFVDLKFTQADKDKALMIMDCREDMAENQRVAGVLGYRIDDRYRIDSTTRDIIMITILNNTDTI